MTQIARCVWFHPPTLQKKLRSSLLFCNGGNTGAASVFRQRCNVAEMIIATGFLGTALQSVAENKWAFIATENGGFCGVRRDVKNGVVPGAELRAYFDTLVERLECGEGELPPVAELRAAKETVAYADRLRLPGEVRWEAFSDYPRMWEAPTAYYRVEKGKRVLVNRDEFRDWNRELACVWSHRAGYRYFIHDVMCSRQDENIKMHEYLRRHFLSIERGNHPYTRPGAVSLCTVCHDEWCPISQGGECRCDPDMTVSGEDGLFEILRTGMW